MDRPKILVVDNVPDNIEVLDKILGHDYEIFSGQDGFDAISMAEAKQPDLIILNIIMSGMDGFETCRKPE